MPVPASISELATAASSNSPAGSESPITADDYLRTYASFIAQLRDEKDSLAGQITDLGDSTEPLKGARLVGRKRASLSSVISNVAQALDAQPYSIWEFADAITDRPTSGDPATWDWAPAFLAARAAALISFGKIVIPGGTYKFGGSTAFHWDPSKFSIVGDGPVVIDCSGFSGAHALEVYATRVYPEAGLYNTVNEMTNLIWKGGKASGRHGMLLGNLGSTAQYNGQTNFRNCAWTGFDSNMVLGTSAWRPAFYNCSSTDALTWVLDATSGTVDAGEVIDWYHCQLYDGAGDIRIAGPWMMQFHGCSILNTSIIVNGQQAQLEFFGGNIENPGTARTFRYFDITGDTNSVTLHGTSVVMNQPAQWTVPPFHCSTNNTLTLVDVFLPANEYPMESTGGIRQFCSGDGNVRGVGTRYPALSGGRKSVLALAANALAQGQFQGGLLTAWTVAPYGPAGSTAVVDAAYAKAGAFGCRLTSVNTGGINVSQEAPAKPGDLILASAWAKVITARASGSINGQIQVSFLGAGNVQLKVLAGTFNLALNTWTVVGEFTASYAPPGTQKVRVNLNAQNGGVIDVDTVILNVL